MKSVRIEELKYSNKCEHNIIFLNLFFTFELQCIVIFDCAL